MERAMTKNEFEQLFAKGPVCLEKMFTQKKRKGSRNVFLYNTGLLLLAQEKDLQKLYKLNASLTEPLKKEEVDSMIKLLEAKDLYYQCPILPGCEKDLCKKRPYGAVRK